MKTTITMMLLLLNFLLCYSCENKELETITDQPQAGTKASAKKTSMIGEQKQHTFSSAAGGTRGYYISVPENYVDTKQYRLVFVFAGTDSTGEFMHEWMGEGWNSNTPGLEKLMTNTIFVYPDQKYVWGNGTGWALGNYAGQFSGMHDIQFTKELLALIKQDYSIDKNRIFATGHSWGGDMANVTAYFLKGVFKAIAPVASNRPYWFESNGSYINEPAYTGNTAVWIFFGLDDDHFGNTSIDGAFGEEQADFWKLKNNASQNPNNTSPIGSQGDVTEKYNGTSEVKLTLYSTGQYSGSGSLPGHQPPDYYFKAVTDWFKTF